MHLSKLHRDYEVPSHHRHALTRRRRQIAEQRALLFTGAFFAAIHLQKTVEPSIKRIGKALTPRELAVLRLMMTAAIKSIARPWPSHWCLCLCSAVTLQLSKAPRSKHCRHGVSVDIGSKHALGYFLVRDGNCDLTAF
jgi:hypothetical protein